MLDSPRALSAGGPGLPRLDLPRLPLAQLDPPRVGVGGETVADGGSVSWWQRCCDGAPLETLLAEAAQWPAGCGGLTFLPYLSGERAPHHREDIRGSFSGLSSHHDRGALTRAVIEGVACSLADVLDLFDGAPAGLGRISGGLVRSGFAAEIIASVTQRELSLTEVDEGSAHGAALLAGIGAGSLCDLEEAASVPGRRGRIFPTSDTAAYTELLGRYRALYARLFA